MTSRHGPGVFAAGTPSSLSKSGSSATSPTSTRFSKNSANGGSQQQKPQATSPTKSSGGPSNSSSSFFSASKQSESAAAANKESTGSKLTRRDSTKSKQGDGSNRKSIFGWIRHHIGDANETAASSSGSRGTKKKLETAASFARNHLSDSMPSLVVQMNTSASSASSKQPLTGSGGIDKNTAAEVTAVSTSVDAIRYRQNKNAVVMTCSDDGTGGSGSRLKTSRSMRTLSGRNRWSSYDITGYAAGGLPLVTVEDSDESLAGDEDGHSQRQLNPPGVPQHHLTDSAASTRARSVETLYLGTAVVEDHTSVNVGQQPQHAASCTGLNADLKSTSGDKIIASSTSLSSSLNGSTEPDLLEKLRRVDESIEKARNNRNQLVAQLLRIPHLSTTTTEDAQTALRSNDQRELMLTSFTEVDRLTSCICDVLRVTDSVRQLATRGSLLDHSGAANEATATKAFLADRASLQLFLDVGVRLKVHLSDLKQVLDRQHVSNEPTVEETQPSADVCIPVVPDSLVAPPCDEPETSQLLNDDEVIASLADLHDDSTDLEISTSQEEITAAWPITIEPVRHSVHSTETVINLQSGVSISDC